MGLYKLPKLIGINRKPAFGTRINWHHPLSQGLVGAWLMNEGGGNLLYDSTMNNGYLTSTGNWYGNGQVFVKASSQVASAIKSQITIPFSIIVKCRSTAVVDNRLIEIAKNTTVNEYILIGMNTTRGYEYQIRNAENNFDENGFSVASSSIIDTNWHTVAGMSETSALHKIFVDGILKDTDTHITTCPTITHIGIGGEVDSVPAYSDSMIEYCYLYNRALSGAEIASLYANPYQMFWHPMRDIYIIPEALPPIGGKSIFGYDSIFHAGGIIQT